MNSGGTEFAKVAALQIELASAALLTRLWPTHERFWPVFCPEFRLNLTKLLDPAELQELRQPVMKELGLCVIINVLCVVRAAGEDPPP